MGLQVQAYESAKYLLFAVGAERLLRIDPSMPASPPSSDVRDWGLKGVEAGREFLKANPPDILDIPG